MVHPDSSAVELDRLPVEVATALRAVLDGARPRDLESQHVDFKEDPATTAHRNPDAQRIEVLLDAAVCFANAEGESHIILGVRDKDNGRDALTGTTADPDDIRRRIFQGTRPNLTVEVTPVDCAGVRLLCIRVPQGLAVYSRTRGSARIREGDRCRELSEQERHEIFFRRANPDLTSRPSALRFNDLDPDALTQAVRLLQEREPDRPVTSAEEALRRLGVLTETGVLLIAAEILLGHPVQERVMARHLWRRTPTSEPSTTEYPGPLLLALPRLRERIAALSDPEVARVSLETGQERPIPDFPASAIDESVLNAFAHRDWASQLPIDVDQSPLRLRIDSPGSLPHGVELSRILSTRSMPRNVVLMRALHRLGLVEETSRGFDRMFTAMLRDGRHPPDVQADEFHVSVTFLADDTDTAFVRWVTSLAASSADPENVLSVHPLLALRHLQSAPTLSAHHAARLFQIGTAEAQATLEWLARTGTLAPAHGSHEWQLSDTAREALGRCGGEAPREGALEQWILATVEAGTAVTNRGAVAATGAPSRAVTQVLRYLADTHRIEKDPDGPQRGSGVRWVAKNR